MAFIFAIQYSSIKLRKVSHLQLLLGSFQNKVKALREI